MKNKGEIKSAVIGILPVAACLALLMCVRYYPMLDDFIQYRVYTFSDDRLRSVLLALGLLSARPLAGIFDVYFWSSMWGSLNMATAVMFCIFAAAGMIMLAFFRRWWGTGGLVFAVLLLCPISMEGVFWLSASTRMGPPLLFCALAMLALELRLKKGGRGFFALYVLFALCSYCFYEQMTIVSFLLLLMALYYDKRARAAEWAAPFAALVPVACCYLFVPSGMNEGRMKLVTFGADYPQHFMGVMGQIRNVFFNLGPRLLKRDLMSECSAIAGRALENPAAAALAAAAAVCVAALFFIIAARTDGEDRAAFAARPALCQLVCGAALFAAPLTLFFLLPNSFIAFRNALPSMLGAGLTADAAVRLVCGGRPRITRAVTLVVCAVLTAASLFEVTAYSKTGEADAALLEELCPYVAQGRQEGNVALVGASVRYDPSVVPHGEHITSVASSDWALTGAVYARNGAKYGLHLYPLEMDKYIYQTYPEPGAYDAFYGVWGAGGYDPGHVAELSVFEAEDGYELRDANGALFARIVREADRWAVYGAGYTGPKEDGGETR